MKNITSQRGSIALISLLIISVISMVLVVGAAETSISTSYQYLNNSSAKVAYYLAEGCLEEAITRLEDNSDFTTTNIPLTTDSKCTVNVSGTSIKTVTIDVENYNYKQTFEATLTLTSEGVVNNADLSAWKEV
jgi:type II secretory pathway component PulK